MKTTTNDDANGLDRALEFVKSNKGRHENMGQYHQELVKWARNVDKRYAWVILAALWLIMAACLGPYRLYGLIFAKVTSEGIYSRQEASWPVSMILTVENVCGPLVSIIAYHISGRNSIFVGGLLLTLGNALTYWSDSLFVDVITLGFVQGIGFAFIFMPFMEVINSYFLKYRNAALGFALCGGTMSIFITEPIFQWLLRIFPWRVAYLGFGAICSTIIILAPFLKPNNRPEPPQYLSSSKAHPRRTGSALSRMSFRVLSYQNSQRRQSTILVSRGRTIDRQASIISVNPFASTVGLERKISRSIIENCIQPQQQTCSSLAQQPTQPQPAKLNKQLSEVKRAAGLDDKLETSSLSEIGERDPESGFGLSSIVAILKTPGFHLIWYSELVYYWVFSIFCLVLVDFGIDRGCTLEQAERLLSFQSIGEILGRMFLTILVDLHLLSNRTVVMLNLCIVGALLVLITQIHGYIMMASLTVLINAFASLLYILLNGLLVDFLGENQVTIGYGMASFIVGILITFRPTAVGYFRDTLGSYDWLMISLGGFCALGAVLCQLERLLTRVCSNKDNAPHDNSSIA